MSVDFPNIYCDKEANFFAPIYLFIILVNTLRQLTSSLSNSGFQPSLRDTALAVNHFWIGREKIFYALSCITFALFEI